VVISIYKEAIMKPLLLTMKILLYWLVLSVGCSVLYLYAGYPTQWDSIKKGMSRTQLHIKLGQPRTCCSWDIKGDFYVHSTPWGEWEFMAAPSADNPSEIGTTRIWLFIGPNREVRRIVKEDESYVLGIYIDFF